MPGGNRHCALLGVAFGYACSQLHHYCSAIANAFEHSPHSGNTRFVTQLLVRCCIISLHVSAWQLCPCAWPDDTECYSASVSAEALAASGPQERSSDALLRFKALTALFGALHTEAGIVLPDNGAKGEDVLVVARTHEPPQFLELLLLCCCC